MAINPKQILDKMKKIEASHSGSSTWFSDPRDHRGVDITYTSGTSTSMGTHLHIGKGNPADSLGRWVRNEDLTDLLDSAREEGRKEALLKIWNLIPHAGETTVLLNSGDVIMNMSMSNEPSDPPKNQAIVHKDFLFPEGAGEEVPTIISMAIDELEVGWYQDDKADLYYYEGEKHWKETTLSKSKELTEEAILGKLEYIG